MDEEVSAFEPGKEHVHEVLPTVDVEQNLESIHRSERRQVLIYLIVGGRRDMQSLLARRLLILQKPGLNLVLSGRTGWRRTGRPEKDAAREGAGRVLLPVMPFNT